MAWALAARVSVAICPPFPYLALASEILKGSRVALGAQNLYPEKDGAFTGEVSPTMLLDLGCKYVILGHSERRDKLGETDAFINQKVRFALAAGLDVILCVGETRDQRDAGQTDAVLDRQVTQGLAQLSAELEPPDHRLRTNLGNRQHRTRCHPAAGAGGPRCYSAPLRADVRREIGSSACHPVRRKRQAGERRRLLGRPGVDGALIGGASLQADQFLAIVRAGISAV
jgi:triosephosphate isomerase